MHPYLAVPSPHLFGHRGASGLAPENTLPAFELAVASGLFFLEMDCHATSDGEIVISHDAELDRTTNGSGPIRAHTFAEVAALDAGHRFTPDGGATFPFRDQGVRIPRLRDVLEQFPEERINLEIKQADPPIAEVVVRLIRDMRAEERVLLAAADGAILDHVRALDPGTAIGASMPDVAAFFGALDAGQLDVLQIRSDALQLPLHAAGRDLVTPAVIAAADRLGLALHVWTINDADEIVRLLQMGVTGVMSDYPERLLSASRAAGAR